MSWLALYGAVVGTIGAVTSLVLAGVGIWNSIQSVKNDQIQLELSGYGKLDLTIQRPYPAGHIINPSGRPVPMYYVKVTNKGSVDAPLNDVGIVDANGQKHRAENVTATEPISNALVFVSPFNDGCTLAPRSTRTFEVFWHEGQDPFTATEAYVEDGTGKSWRCHVR